MTMSYKSSHNPLLHEFLPHEPTVEQGYIMSIRYAANWLECAAIETYPMELRAAWRQRGKEWLDLSSSDFSSGFTFTSDEHYWTLMDDLDRAEKFWEMTMNLGSYCRSHLAE